MRLIDETAYQNIIAKIPIGERSFVKAWETAQDMPTIYAVPVVRCKDCLKRNTSMCHAWHEQADMDYCSHGVNKLPPAFDRAD